MESDATADRENSVYGELRFQGTGRGSVETSESYVLRKPDLTSFAAAGDRVLILGLGTGQSLLAAAFRVGREGRVICVDREAERLAEARRLQQQFLDRTGYQNIEIRQADRADLKLDLEELEAWLTAHPARNSNEWLQASAYAEHLRQHSPLIADESVNTILMEDGLNTLPLPDRPSLFAEFYRILRRGGRVVLRATVSDEDVPHALQRNRDMWNAGLSGAVREDQLLETLELANLHGMQIVDRAPGLVDTLAGIEFRSITLQAFKGKLGPCLERRQAVIYNGPWKAVIDDDGHTLYRGKRMAVCDKTFQIYSQAPYADKITPVPPVTEIPYAEARPFNCRVDSVRDPRETKGTTPIGLTLLQIDDGCGPTGCC